MLIAVAACHVKHKYTMQLYVGPPARRLLPLCGCPGARVLLGSCCRWLLVALVLVSARVDPVGPLTLSRAVSCPVAVMTLYGGRSQTEVQTPAGQAVREREPGRGAREKTYHLHTSLPPQWSSTSRPGRLRFHHSSRVMTWYACGLPYGLSTAVCECFMPCFVHTLMDAGLWLVGSA